MRELLMATVLFLLISAAAVEARVKMVALPERARVVVSLSHPDAALVEEERMIGLQKGVNAIDFSWREVQLDPTTIQIQVLSHPEEVQVLNTSFPPNENALVWSLASPRAMEERIRISYLLPGLNRDIVYKAVVAPDETNLTLRNYLRLRNDSGEDLTQAEIRLGYGRQFTRTVEGGEILELLSERLERVPIRKQLTWDSQAQPWDPEKERATVGLPLIYLLQNDKDSKLGEHTLAPGKARLFLQTREPGGNANEEESSAAGVAFLGEDWVQLTPVDRELKLSIGQSREVKVTQRKIKDERVNIRRNTSNKIVLWDTEETYKVEIENFKKSPVNLLLVEHLPGYWKITDSTHPYKKKDAYTVEFHLNPAAETTGDKKTVVEFKLNRWNVQGNEPKSFE